LVRKFVQKPRAEPQLLSAMNVRRANGAITIAIIRIRWIGSSHHF